MNILHTDSEMYKETIVTQHAELQKMQNRVDLETHRRLLESYFNAQTELDRTKVQLERQVLAWLSARHLRRLDSICYRLRLSVNCRNREMMFGIVYFPQEFVLLKIPVQEQSAHTDRLRAEILSILA